MILTVCPFWAGGLGARASARSMRTPTLACGFMSSLALSGVWPAVLMAETLSIFTDSVTAFLSRKRAMISEPGRCRHDYDRRRDTQAGRAAIG